MDYVTRQFINLTKQFRKDFRSALDDLEKALQKQTEAIQKSAKAQKEHAEAEKFVLAKLENGRPRESHAKTNEKAQHPMEWIKLAVEIAMLFVVAAYAAVTSFQLIEMKITSDAAVKSANAAKSAADTAAEELELSQRPWVDFSFRIIGGLHQESNGITLKVDFSLKNIGHSPALDVFPEAIGFVAYKGHMDENTAQQDLCNRMAAAKGFDHLIPQIFTDRPAIHQPVIVTFNQADIEAAKPGGFFQPVILGCIDYHSSFSDKHLQAPFIYDICWSSPPPANGCLTMTFPIKEWPVQNLRYMNDLNGSGTTR